MIFATNATGAGGSERMRITNAGFVTIKNNAGVNNASLTFSNSDTGVGIDQSIGYLNFYSNDVSTSSLGGVGGIAVKAEEAFNTSFTPTYMSFYTHERTTNDGTTLGNVIERMRINSSGQVLIGDIAGTSPNGADRFLKIGKSNLQDCSIILQDAVETWEIYQNDDLQFSFGTTPSTVMTMQRTTGNVGIGTTSPSDKLYVDAGTGSIYAGNFVYGGTDGTKGCLRLRTVASTGPSFIDFFYDGFSTNPLSPVGAIVTTGTATSYASFSDYRMKQNVNDLTNVLDKVVNLKPKTFNYKNVPDIEVQGFLAHELQEVIPQAVHGEKDEVHPDGNPKYQLVDHSHMIPLLTAAIKELKADNDSLRARIETLENK
jgi:hypothetical protein